MGTVFFYLCGKILGKNLKPEEKRCLYNRGVIRKKITKKLKTQRKAMFIYQRGDKKKDNKKT